MSFSSSVATHLSSCSSEMVTIDRYCQDRFIDLLPVLDVESHVSYEDLIDMWPTFQDILASFPNLRYGDEHATFEKYGRMFLYSNYFLGAVCSESVPCLCQLNYHLQLHK
jgi:hypothetical protein